MSDDFFGSDIDSDDIMNDDMNDIGGEQDWAGLNTEQRFDMLKDSVSQMQDQGMSIPDYSLNLGAVDGDNLMHFGTDHSVTVDPYKLEGAESPDPYTNSLIEGVDTHDEYGFPHREDQHDTYSHAGEVSFGSLAQCEASCPTKPTEPESGMYKVYK